MSTSGWIVELTPSTKSGDLKSPDGLTIPFAYWVSAAPKLSIAVHYEWENGVSPALHELTLNKIGEVEGILGEPQ